MRCGVQRGLQQITLLVVLGLLLVHVSFHWAMDLMLPLGRLLLCAAVVIAGTLTTWASRPLILGSTKLVDSNPILAWSSSMEINLIRSLSSNNYLAYFEGDMALSNQERAISWFKQHQVSGITIGWNVAIDRTTGSLSAFGDVLQQNRSPKWATYSVAEIESFVRLASDNGLTVTLKPYFVDKDTTHNIGGWDEEWAVTNVEAVKKTMAAYLLQTAEMAERNGADALVIGTENSNLSTEWAQQHKIWWDTTIASIRERFDGLLGYSEVSFPHFPTSSRDLDNVSFTAGLDFIGANLYPFVTAGTNPTYSEAVAAWTNNQKAWWSFATEAGAPASVNLLNYLQGISTKFGKPLMLTETGYPATDGAGSNPFKLGPTIDVPEQALLLQAEFDVLKNLDDWFGGLLLFSDNGYHYSQGYEDANAALTADYGYSVVGRPAADVVGSFMQKYQHPILGGTGNDSLIDVVGDNLINGGSGLDTVVLASKHVNYTLTAAFGRHVLKTNMGEVNIVDGIERLQFSDKKLALDLLPTEHTGQALEFIGLLAPSLVHTPSIVGEILGYFDAGQNLQAMCQLALDVGLVYSIAGSNTNAALAAMAFRNVIGSEADAATVNELVSYMDGRYATYSQAEFMAVVAGLEVNQTHIGLVGLQQTGIEYL